MTGPALCFCTILAVSRCGWCDDALCQVHVSSHRLCPACQGVYDAEKRRPAEELFRWLLTCETFEVVDIFASDPHMVESEMPRRQFNKYRVSGVGKKVANAASLRIHKVDSSPDGQAYMALSYVTTEIWGSSPEPAILVSLDRAELLRGTPVMATAMEFNSLGKPVPVVRNDPAGVPVCSSETVGWRTRLMASTSDIDTCVRMLGGRARQNGPQ